MHTRVIYHTNITKLKLLLLSISIIAISTVQASSFSASSNNKTGVLIELYTSEGCSSCPPVDKWLSQLPKSMSNFDNIIPLAFHVDYWDYIGWKDPYASPYHTTRQRHIGRINRLGSIYTPQVVINGRDFRSRGNIAATLTQKSNTSPRANISVTGETKQQQLQLKITTSSKQLPSSAKLYVVLYENGLSSNITDGENSGRELQHNFVVRHLSRAQNLNTSGKTQTYYNINIKNHLENNKLKNNKLGLALFIQDTKDLLIYQAMKVKLE